MERGASRHTAGSRRGQAQKSHLDHFAEQLVDQMIGDSPEKDSGTVEVGSGVAGAVKVVQWDDEEEDDDEEEEAVVTMRRSHGSEKPPIRHAWGSSLEDEESTPVNTKFVSRLQQRHELQVVSNPMEGLFVESGFQPRSQIPRTPERGTVDGTPSEGRSAPPAETPLLQDFAKYARAAQEEGRTPMRQSMEEFWEETEEVEEDSFDLLSALHPSQRQQQQDEDVEEEDSFDLLSALHSSQRQQEDEEEEQSSGDGEFSSFRTPSPPRVDPSVELSPEGVGSWALRSASSSHRHRPRLRSPNL